MSIIAYDGKFIAADKLMSNGDGKSTTQKLFKINNKLFYGFTGAVDSGLLMASWYKNGAKPKEFPEIQKTDNWSRLIVFKNSDIFYYEQTPFAIPCIDKFMAWGSGRDYAIGAMAMGATAVEAVKVAIEHCSSCGIGVDSFSLGR